MLRGTCPALLTLPTKCISPPWGWAPEGWNMEECNSANKVVLPYITAFVRFVHNKLFTLNWRQTENQKYTKFEKHARMTKYEAGLHCQDAQKGGREKTENTRKLLQDTKSNLDSSCPQGLKHLSCHQANKQVYSWQWLEFGDFFWDTQWRHHRNLTAVFNVTVANHVFGKSNFYMLEIFSFNDVV
jgi:hypothetical protein